MKLYRYRKANLNSLTSEILNDEFFLWSLNKQNDPYEGRLLYTNNINKNSLFESLKNTRKALQSRQFKWKDWLLPKDSMDYYEDIKNSSDHELKLIAEKSISRGDYNENGIQLIKENYKKMTDNLVMSCFSGKKNSPVMFAHYADNHAGVCLEYDVDPSDFFKVEYVEDFPKLDLLNADRELLMKYRTHVKHKDWEYEDEYRLIIYNRPIGVYSNDSIKLKSIYLGLNSTEETKEEIKNVLAKRKQNVSLYTLVAEDDSYELKYMPTT